MTRPIAFISIIMLLALPGSAQTGKLGVFLGAGTMFYQGDLVTTAIVPPQTLSWTVDAGLQWQLHRRWAVQLNYTAGDIKGADAFAPKESRRARGFSFQSYVHELSLRAIWHIVPTDRFPLSPYLTAGVGGLYSDLTINAASATTSGLEGSYSPFSLSIPIGIGLLYQINCPWAIKAEAVYHWTLSDHLDGVSERPRGNPKLKDGVWDVNVGVVWFFMGCNKAGNRYEDCDELYKGVDLQKLQDQYK